MTRDAFECEPFFDRPFSGLRQRRPLRGRFAPTGQAMARRRLGVFQIESRAHPTGRRAASMSFADVDRLGSSEPALQSEADCRVIAARCGTPACEKQFFKQSNAAVVAGLVVSSHDASKIEKAIEARRRNPLQLVSTKADCTEKMAALKAVQQQRARTLRAVPRH
jgi:hypothetical protein